MSLLLSPAEIAGMQMRNRIVMSPMCQYSVTKQDGAPNEWHYVHYVSRAVGGVGLVLMEMTDVDPDGRITNFDLGLWSDEQIPAFARIMEGCKAHGARVGVQIAHAGRKAQDAEVPVAPSPIAFNEKFRQPRELTTDEIKVMVEKFRQAARRAVAAGADMVEVHAAHGYLVHQFQSAFTNHRSDVYGQDRTRFGCEVISAMKSELRSGMPLFVRISAREYVDGGYDVDYASQVAAAYVKAGADVIHVSSGGEGPIGSGGRPGTHPGYQVPLARSVRETVGVPTVAVGLLDEPALAESVLGNGDADLIAIGRGLLRDPYWAIHAARKLGDTPPTPHQYERAF